MKLVSRPHFSLLHRVARNVLLPVGKIKDHIQKTIGAGAVSTVLDLGSGMLYWSRWFAARYNCAVYAVDTY
jgi:hypothetical protein